MPHLNPNLLTAAASPIMEAASWVAQADIPADRPLINLSQAAPADAPPEAIRQRLAQAMLDEPSAHFYGDVLGNGDLRQALATRTGEIYGADIPPENVAITAGCNQAFCTTVSTACAPGDAVMLPVPWYFNHKMWLDMAGLACVAAPCRVDMLPDLDAARAAMTDQVRAIALVTPNNPTGAEYPDELLHGFFELAKEHDALLIVDETYRDFLSGSGAPHTLFQRPDWQGTLVHLYSFSKTFRLTGHRTGAIIAAPERLAQAEKFLDTMTICPAQSGQIAALHGLQHLTQWIAGERAEYASRRKALTTGMAQHLPDWAVHGAGAYFAWITPPFGLASDAMARRLVTDQSLLVLPGAMFLPKDTPTQSLRIAFANTGVEGIARTIERLAAFRP